MIDVVLTNTMLPDKSKASLYRRLEGKSIERAAFGVKDGNFSYDFGAAH